MLLPLLRLHSASSFVSRFMFLISLAARACCVPFVRKNMDETSGGNLRYFLTHARVAIQYHDVKSDNALL